MGHRCLEEGREYYRNHPVMKLVTDALLKISIYFYKRQELMIEKAMLLWEKAGKIENGIDPQPKTFSDEFTQLG